MLSRTEKGGGQPALLKKRTFLIGVAIAPPVLKSPRAGTMLVDEADENPIAIRDLFGLDFGLTLAI